MIRLCDSQVAARYCVGVRCTSCLPPASRLQHDGTEHMGTFFPIIGGERFVVFVFFACMGTAAMVSSAHGASVVPVRVCLFSCSVNERSFFIKGNRLSL